MRPQGRAWRKSSRDERHEPELRPAPTIRQRQQALVREAEELAARQAHIDEAWDLPFLLAGTEGVEIVTLEAPEA